MERTTLTPLGTRVLALTAIACLALACSAPLATRRTPAPPRYDAATLLGLTQPFAADVSHDGAHVLAMGRHLGAPNVIAFSVKGGAPDFLTGYTDGDVDPIGYFPNDNRMLFHRDPSGEEFSYVSVRELDGSITHLTPTEGSSGRFLEWSDDGGAFWVATDERRPNFFDVYRYDCDGYVRELVFQNDAGDSVNGVSPDGRWIAVSLAGEDALDLISVEEGSSLRYSPDALGARCRFLAWTPDSTGVAYRRDDQGDFAQAWRYDVASGAHSPEVVGDYDVARLSYSPLGTYCVASVLEDALPIDRIIERGTGERCSLSALPQGAGHLGVVFSRDEAFVAVQNSGTQAPFEIFVCDLTSADAAPRQLSRTLDTRVDVADLVEAETVRFTSRDGLEVPGFLYRPIGASADRPVPAVVQLHGGPGGMSFRTWDPELQHLACQGYAVLCLNYRGSSGYGRTFRALGEGQHGEGDVADIAAAHEWLAARDWVDGNRIGVFGTSFGGYLALATMVRYPELFAVGVNQVGPVNWISTLEIAAERLGPRVEWQYRAIGHPVRDAERLRRVSPYFHADRIARPVLMVHGRNDPRYDMEELHEFTAQIAERGVPAEQVLLDGEGHVAQSTEQRVAGQEAIVRFLDRYLRQVTPR